MGRGAPRFKGRSGIQLHVGLLIPQPLPQGMVSLNPWKGDLLHDPRELPWPLEDESVVAVWVHRVLEYVPPERVNAWMEQLSRVLIVGGKAYLSGAYGMEFAWQSDPAHTLAIWEHSFWGFDPRAPAWQRFRPKTALQTVAFTRVPGAEGPYYNAILEKLDAINTSGQGGVDRRADPPPTHRQRAAARGRAVS